MNFLSLDHVVMSEQKPTKQDAETPVDEPPAGHKKVSVKDETGGPQGPEPTRYGDWERKGRCVDF
jgi:hypothetical protein